VDEIIRGPGERLAAYRPPRFGEGSVSTALHLGPLAATRRGSGFNAILRPLDPDSRPEGSRRRVRRGAYSVGLDIAPNLIGQCAGIRRTRGEGNVESVFWGYHPVPGKPPMRASTSLRLPAVLSTSTWTESGND